MHKALIGVGGLTALVLLCLLFPGCARPTPETPETKAPGQDGATAPAGPSVKQPEPPKKPANPGDALELTHRLSPATYTPGEELEVVVNMNYVGDDPITALAIRQIVPEGWTFVAVTGGIQPAVTPRPDATGTLDFVWITTPDWPNNFSYALRAPVDAQGAVEFQGQGIYRTSGPELRTTPVLIAVPAG